MAAQETPASTRAAVDVLAVMNSALGDLMVAQVGGIETETGVPEISSAIDAVAELIEAASDHMNGLEIGEVARKKRLLIALARVTGGAQ